MWINYKEKRWKKRIKDDKDRGKDMCLSHFKEGESHTHKFFTDLKISTRDLSGIKKRLELVRLPLIMMGL
jgi:hypothetical protein